MPQCPIYCGMSIPTLTLNIAMTIGTVSTLLMLLCMFAESHTYSPAGRIWLRGVHAFAGTALLSIAVAVLVLIWQSK